jgi:hypothetical protein
MIIDYTKIPFSWQELNTKLGDCASTRDVKKAFSLEGTSLTDLVNRILYPMRSYDPDPVGGELLLNQLKRLYPDLQGDENRAFYELQQKILLQSNCLRPEAKEIAEPSEPPQVKVFRFLEDFRIKEELISFDAYLECASKAVQNVSKDRCEEALLVHSKTSSLSEPKGLQLMLSYLLAEKEYVQRAINLLEGMEKLHEMDLRYREGADRIISLSLCEETRLYDVTELAGEECDFWVSLSSYIDFRKMGERVFVYFPPLFRTEHDKGAILHHWQQIADNHSHPKLREIASKLILGFEFSQMITHHTQQMRDFPPYISKWMKLLNSFSSQFYQDVFLLMISPFCRLLDIRLSKFFCDGLKQERFQIFQVDVVREMKKIIRYWQDHQCYQENLYHHAYNELRGRIKGSGKQKRNLLQFTKYLMGNSAADLLPERYRESAEEQRKGIRRVKQKPFQSPQATPKMIKSAKKAVSSSSSPTASSLSSSSSASSSCSSSSSSSSSSEAIMSVFSYSPPSLSEFPGEPFPFFLDKRVARWDEHPFGELLTQEAFPEYWQLGVEFQELEHLFHSPHYLVDRFFHLGIDSLWNSHDRESERKVIPAEIAYKGKVYRGYLAYAIDKTSRICYHRYFSRQIDKDFLCQIIRKSFDQVDFPDLQHTARCKHIPEGRIVKCDSDTMVQIHPLFGTVLIEDRLRGVKIKLFKTSFL